MLDALYVFLQKIASVKLEAAQGVVIGALVTGLITLVTAVVTSWLRTRMERNQWQISKKEEAYRECLDLLCFSRRWPEGNRLEKTYYLGAMASINKLPMWLQLVLNYSSETSREVIKGDADRLSDAIKRQKQIERDANKSCQSVETDSELFDSVEKLLTKVRDCSGNELAIRSFWDRLWGRIRHSELES